MSSRWKVPIHAGILLVISLVFSQARAQDYVYATGNPNFGVNYPIPGGYINVTNGNVHITIPLGTFKQRGTLPPIKINLEYDSRIWKISDNGSYSWQPNNVPNSMAGWRLTTGLEQGTTSYVGYTQYSSVSGTCFIGNHLVQDYTESWTILTGFRWTDGSGTKHTFDVQTEEPTGVCSGDNSHTIPNASGYAIDGSGYFVQITNYTQMTIYDNQGNEVYPIFKDANNNQATLSTSGTLTDSMGRQLLTTTTGTNSITYQVLREGGISKYIANMESVQVNTAFGQSAVSEYAGTLNAIESIELPDGSSYSFTYDPDSYGEMTSMTLPTGGVVTFDYENYLDSYSNYNRWISLEQENGYGTAFAPSVISQCTTQPTGCQEQMTVTRPSGDSRVYNLTMNNGAWDGETDTYQGSTKLLTVVNNYTFNAYPCSSQYICNGSEYIAASSSTATLNDVSPNLTATTCYTYSSPQSGKVSAIQEWDYSGSAISCTSPSTPNRETDYTYGTVLNGASLLTQELKKFNGASFSQTAYTYDANGNMKTITQGLSGNQATTSYAYDGNGMRISKTDPNGNLTSYNYDSMDGYITQTTYPQTNGVTHIMQASPDPNTGDPITTTDQNGQVTHYDYDSVGRKTLIQYPDGGQTAYSYPSANEVVESKLLSGSTNSTVTTTWDGYGRKVQVSQSDPAGNDVVTYSYDADNRLQYTTNPQRTGSSSTNGNTWVQYDALDRPTLITLPDNKTIQVSYSGNQATVTDENGHQKRYQYDAFHDLTAIWEPNATGSPSWETGYTYDPAGHVLSITQSGDGSSAARQRTFQYSSLGKLVQESTPEGGAKTYAYDANGNLTSESTPRGTITYSYDALNRMTQKSSSDFTYSYIYDSASPGGGFTSTNPIGRLVEAWNNVNAGSYYSYDAMGRVISQGNCIPTNCSATANPIQATYDLAGDLTSITYPDGRVIAESYDSAKHLTGVEYASWNGQSVGTPYYSATAFAPTGETTAATFGNGVQMSASFNSRQSLTALSYATASQTLWSKQYTWAANAKNLLQIADMLDPSATYNFTYDPDNRLIAASGGSLPATAGTGSVTVNGAEQSACVVPASCTVQHCGYTVYDYGQASVTIGTTTQAIPFTEGSTSSSVASSIAAAFNGNSSSPASAAVSGNVIQFTSKATGTASNYPISVSVTYKTQNFSASSFTLTASGSSLAGGTNAVAPGAAPLQENYSLDPWGNMQQSGNFSFTQAFTTNNQISGFTYDAAGDLLNDSMNTYTYDNEGMLTSSGGAQYVYDALQQRVEKTGGSNAGEVVYFSGHPLALLNPSSNSWTDLIWAGSDLIAEVPGSQSGSPVYRLLDHEGSLAATVNSTGGILATNLFTPYGQWMNSGAGDAYSWTGLYQDTEYSGDAAWYRNYSTRQARWLTPDPYNGSYDLYDPQSFNRYMYVSGNPLGFTDPSGMALGIVNGVGGSVCTGAGDYLESLGYGSGGSVSTGLSGGVTFNPCNPIGSVISIGLYELFGISSIAKFAHFAPFVSAGITIACSIDYNQAACGPKGWASEVIGGDFGKVVGDTLAVAGDATIYEYGSACAASAGNPANPACDYVYAVALYTAFNDLFSYFFGPPQFTGSLLPRPSDLGGLGTAPIGIPSQDLGISRILGRPSHPAISSPGVVLP